MYFLPMLIRIIFSLQDSMIRNNLLAESEYWHVEIDKNDSSQISFTPRHEYNVYICMQAVLNIFPRTFQC